MTATSDGFIKFWDTRRACNLPISEINKDRGFTSLDLDIYGTNLLAGSMNYKLYEFNLLLNEKQVNCYEIGCCSFFHRSRWSKDGNFFISGLARHTGDAGIWKKGNSTPILLLKGHTNEVTDVDWSFDKIVTCSDDGTARLWTLHKN